MENAGSLTIVTTARTKTGNHIDNFIISELEDIINMTIKLDGRLADRRLFPAININASSTNKEELLLSADEPAKMRVLRKMIGPMDEAPSLSYCASA